MKVGKGVVAVTIILQYAVIPEPLAREVLRAVMPLDAAAGRTEGLGEFTGTAQRVELAHQLEQRLGQVLAPQEDPAEGPLIQRMVLVVSKALLPVLYPHEQLALARRIAPRERYLSWYLYRLC